MTPADRPAGRWPIRSYSHNGEDVRLWRVFRRVRDGFYVDVGAGDPTIGSVTRLFYDSGWTGINVEPGPAYTKLAHARPRDVNLNVAAGLLDGTAEFLVTRPDPHLSTMRRDVLAWSSDRIESVETVKIPQRRLDSILAEHAQRRRIDFLKVDVEGAERDVLEGSDWKRFRPAVVIVEAIRPWSREPTHAEWENILTGNGYVFAAFDGINRLYVTEDERALIEELAYPLSALDNYVALGEHHATDIAQAKEDDLQRRLAELESENKDLRTERVAAKKRALDSEKKLRKVLASPTWRAGRALRRILQPAEPTLRPGIRLARSLRARRRGQPLQRPVRKARPADVLERYRNALAPGLPHAFPLPGRPFPPSSGPDPRLERVRQIMATGPAARNPWDLLEVIRATGHHEDAVLLEDRLSYEQRTALVHAEIAALLQDPPAGSTEPATHQRGARPSVVVDVRSLQSRSFNSRGVGRHARHVLRVVCAFYQDLGDVVFLVDPGLPPLPDDIAAQATRSVASIAPDDLAHATTFVELSPMTASPGPALPLLLAPGIRCVAVVYDFIPADHPGHYLASDARAIVHQTRLEALDRYDHYLAISDATAAGVEHVLGHPVASTVTGVSGLSDEDVEAGPDGSSNPVNARHYAVVSVGSDPRKNLLAGIAAWALSPKARASRLALVFAGAVPEPMIEYARGFANACGLPADRITFTSGLTDRELLTLYERAAFTVVPSFDEGFSIPVVEAIWAGTPVVASRIDAHKELVGDGWWLSAPEDPAELARSFDRVLTERRALLDRQRTTLGERYTKDWVAERIVVGLASTTENDPPVARPSATKKRPRVAVLTPFPPQHSGIATYSDATMRALAMLTDVVVFAHRDCVVPDDPGIELRPYSMAPFIDRGFDAVISVLGNSGFHVPALEYFLEFGGAVIAHDPRMAEIYRAWRGPGHTAALLSRHTEEPVAARDLSHLFAQPDRLPGAVFDEIAPRARPLMVHSAGLAARIRAETGVEAVVLPFVPHRVPSFDAVDREVVEDARRFLGWGADGLHIATFGIVSRRTKATEVIIDALAFLRRWDIGCTLHIVGPIATNERTELTQRARRLGVEDALRITGRVPLDELDAYLIAVDAGVQLRTYSQAPLSGALLDCIAFGIPSVATAGLTTEMEAPAYVRSVTDRFSGLLLAEQLGALIERRRVDSAGEIEPQRREWLAQRTTRVYAERLLAALGVSGVPR